ncbi:MAG: NAD(P)/FAD-dependent oxidoreductase [Nocardioidaceae bacterium]
MIVGASLAGLRTAEELRAAGYEGAITLVGKETHLPYDRPPLSKQLLTGARTAADVTLRGQADLDRLDVQLLLGRTATSVDDERVVLDHVDAVPYSDLVVATGVAARRLANQPSSDNVHVLRTLDDAIRLRDHLGRARSLLVVGAGFIGAEVAAVARQQGLEVTMVEALAAPFARALGNQVGARCRRLHEDHGVRIVTDARVSSFASSASGATLRLADGTALEADCVLVGVGTTTNQHWLSGVGLAGAGGVACDATGRVEGHRNLFAVGDVASWQNPTFGARHRVEHWTNAVEQAHVLAHTLLGVPPPRSNHEVPYFWSDQYRTKLQLVGRPDLADTADLLELPGRPGRLLGMYFRSSRLVAAVTFNAPAVLARLRPLVAAMTNEEAARATAADLVGIAA